MKELIDNKILVEDLKTIILATKEQVAISVNSSLTLLYWNIGKKIEEDILKNSKSQLWRTNCAFSEYTINSRVWKRLF